MKMHFVRDASHDLYEVTTACGIDGWRNDGTSNHYQRRDRDSDFQASFGASSVTCKRCLAHYSYPSPETNMTWVEGVENAPYASTVLASYFDGSVGEWIVQLFVADRPSAPFTHWMHVARPNETPAPPEQTEGGSSNG
ncbi:hypothetical protein D3C71_688610 [compost metagenome]